VICSEKGWIRSIKGHIEDLSEVRYKEGDRAKFVLRAQTTDKLLVFGTNGRFYTIGCDKLPGGRGNGEPLRLMIDLDAGHDVVVLLVHRPGGRLLVAPSPDAASWSKRMPSSPRPGRETHPEPG
jgi:topoisomerase-4 subunit A